MQGHVCAKTEVTASGLSVSFVGLCLSTLLLVPNFPQLPTLFFNTWYMLTSSEISRSTYNVSQPVFRGTREFCEMQTWVPQGNSITIWNNKWFIIITLIIVIIILDFNKSNFFIWQSVINSNISAMLQRINSTTVFWKSISFCYEIELL